jgi:hypothetical protein
LSEAPLFFIAVVVAIAFTFRIAVGWAKAPSAEDTAADPTRPTSSQPAQEGAPAKTPTPVVTAEPRPAATATVPSTRRKKPRPRH